MDKVKEKDKIDPITTENKRSKNDTRKQPAPGYAEKTPSKTPDIQEHPEDQNSG